MKLLERYLLQVEKYLPLKDRKDTLEELKNLLLEDIAERTANGQPEEDAEYEVIKTFGDPRKVALKYRNDNAIISREMEPLLYLLLKIIIIVVPSSILLASIVGYLNSDVPFDFIDFLLEILFTIPDMFSAALTGVGTVFIIFAIIEKYFKSYVIEELEKEGFLGEDGAVEFDPKNLPKIPDSVYKVSIFESVIAIIGGIVFLYLFNYQPGLIAVYFDGERLLLLNDSFNNILPIINAGLIFGLIIETIHLIKRQKSLTTTTFELINKMIGVLIFILLATSDVLNQIVIDGYELEVLSTMFIIGMWVGATANFFGGIYTYIKILIKRNEKENIQ
jgi:hypothetical protein